MGKIKALALAGTAAIVISAAPAAFANVLAPGDSGAPDGLPYSFAPNLASTAGTFLSNIGDFSGDYQAGVYSDPLNTFGAGDLTFYYQISSNHSSTEDIEKVSASFFTGFKTDVGYLTTFPIGSTPSLVDRGPTGGVIDWDIDVGRDGESDYLVVMTDAHYYTTGNLSIQNAGNATVSAYAPTAAPEPATWAMMLLGFAGLGYAGFRSRKSAVSIA
jgi:hypothetical protein